MENNMRKDYYDILGIDKDSDQATIKQAYRNLARKYHPDVCKDDGAEEKIKEINEAYDVLSDHDKKYSYDNFGQWNSQHSTFNGNGFDFPFGFDSIFDSLFNNMRNQRSRPVRQNSQVDGIIEIPLGMATKYNKIEFKYNRIIACQLCNNSDNINICQACNGNGTVIHTIQQGPMRIQNRVQCTSCGGTGRMYNSNCEKCGGAGIYQIEDKIVIDVPPYAIGKTMVIQQRGNQEFLDIPAGALSINIKPEKHPYYVVLPDLTCLTFIRVNPVQAILGGNIIVKDFNNNDIDVELPQNTNNGDRIIISNEGLYVTKEERAPVVAEIIYDNQGILTEQQQEALKIYLEQVDNKYIQEKINEYDQKR